MNRLRTPTCTLAKHNLKILHNNGTNYHFDRCIDHSIAIGYLGTHVNWSKIIQLMYSKSPSQNPSASSQYANRKSCRRKIWHTFNAIFHATITQSIGLYDYSVNISIVLAYHCQIIFFRRKCHKSIIVRHYHIVSHVSKCVK